MPLSVTTIPGSTTGLFKLGFFCAQLHETISHSGVKRDFRRLTHIIT